MFWVTLLSYRRTEGIKRDPLSPRETSRDSLTFPLSRVRVRVTRASTYLLEGRKVLGSDGGGVGGADSFRLPGSRVRGGPRAADGAGRTGAPATPRPRCSAFPAARARRGRRSPGAVAGRGVQGALWPSGAGGWSGHRGARGFAVPVRLQRPGRPAVACAPGRAPPRSPGPAWRRRPREPMRLEGRRASASAAATAAPSGVRGFAAAAAAAAEPC